MLTHSVLFYAIKMIKNGTLLM